MKTYISLEDVEAKWPEQLAIKKVPKGFSVHEQVGRNQAIEDCRSALSSAERVRMLTKEEIFDILRKTDWFSSNRKTTHEDMWQTAEKILSAMKEPK